MVGLRSRQAGELDNIDRADVGNIGESSGVRVWESCVKRAAGEPATEAWQALARAYPRCGGRSGSLPCDHGKEKGCAGKHGLEWGDMCGGCQRPHVCVDGSGVNSGRMDGARLCCL
jgi:hypothetical protein